MTVYVDSETLRLMRKLRVKYNQDQHEAEPYANSYLVMTEGRVWSFHLGCADLTASPRSLDGNVLPNKGLTEALKPSLVERVEEMRRRADQNILDVVPYVLGSASSEFRDLMKEVEEALEK